MSFQREIKILQTFCHIGSVFLMVSVPSGSKIYRTSTASKIHAALHFVQKAECTKYAL
jgi:hypothetical protein